MSAGITIVIPAHNYAHFIGEAFESLVAQTRPPDEVVVVDDGSTDRLADVIEQAKAVLPPVTVVRHDRPLGLNAARNAGIRASHGEFILLLDADDRLSSRALELLEKALNSDQRVGFAYLSTRMFGAREAFVEAHTFTHEELLRRNRVNASTMFRRTLFDSVGGFNRALDGLGLDDWDFWISAIEHGYRGLPVSSEAWLEYRQHPGSLNRISIWRLLRARWQIRALHPDSIRARHFLQGSAEDLAWRAYEWLRRRRVTWSKLQPSGGDVDPVDT